VRVLHVIPSIAPRYGGPSQAVVGMSRVLQEQGSEVLIATTDADGPHRLQVNYGTVTTFDGVPAIFFSRQWSEAFKYSRPLATWLDENVERFDIVHIHAVFSHACLVAAQASRRHRIPYVVRPLGTLDPWSMRQKPLRKKLLWQLGAKQMLAGAAAVHYTALEEKRLAETSMGVCRGVVVPLGVSEQYFADNPSASEAEAAPKYVLSVARLHPKKALDQLIDAFLSATNEPDLGEWKLLIAGDGDAAYVEGLKQLAVARGGQDRVRFTGWLQGEEKLNALRGADLFASPSHQENFGIAAVEAMACGVPVLISPHVNLADDVDAVGAGWIVAVEQSALIDALTTALRDPVERKRRGAAARDLARSQFSWTTVGHQLGTLYNNVVAQVAC
jgi:glycosyltransferase involved in cell wall biosynthesis